jgi:hypothetical protein
MSKTSQIKTSSGDGGGGQRNDQPEIADGPVEDAGCDGGVAGRVPTPSITQRQAIILAAVAVVVVAVYLYTRRRDDEDGGGVTASAYAERDGGEGFQEAAEESPEDLDLDELEQASETGVAADRQVVNWMQDRDRLASED